MRERAIGVFDSGLGGLAVVREIMREMPEEDIFYFADFKNLPYGPRPLKQVEEFAHRIIDFLIANGVKAVLIACNTASVAIAASVLQKEWQVPVIGMLEPAVEATLKSGNFRKIGIIGTIGTIKSGEYIRAFERLSPSVEVVGHACPDLLHLAEQGEIMDRRRIQLLAKECINPLEREGIDALVLGCTDFTCIIEELQAVIAPQIILIDPAQEIAKKADKVLRENGWRRSGEGYIKFFASGEGPRKTKDFAQRVFGIQFENITIVDYIT